MGEEALDFDLLAASLRADGADTHAWMAALATKLAGALPSRVGVRHGGLFGNGAVEGVSADLGNWRFDLHLQHGQPVAERTHVVRGIALKSEVVPIDEWIDALSRGLAAIAATSTRERAAIMGLLT